MTADLPLSPGWTPSACTLPTAERLLRVAEFDELFARSVRSVRRPAPDRLELNLDPDGPDGPDGSGGSGGPGVAARAAGLAARENACCSFFTFTLTIGSGGLTLAATVPPRHTGVLDALQARAGGRPA
ncbi:hypothetical protein [Nonomuraea sp. NPDC001023]|uniref:hypothetical protein n=1 Tax=unclassified Nonomuraea TaxID=2593643 RepID=UPI003321FFE3